MDVTCVSVPKTNSSEQQDPEHQLAMLGSRAKAKWLNDIADLTSVPPPVLNLCLTWLHDQELRSLFVVPCETPELLSRPFGFRSRFRYLMYHVRQGQISHWVLKRDCAGGLLASQMNRLCIKALQTHDPEHFHFVITDVPGIDPRLLSFVMIMREAMRTYHQSYNVGRTSALCQIIWDRAIASNKATDALSMVVSYFPSLRHHFLHQLRQAEQAKQACQTLDDNEKPEEPRRG